MIQSSKGVLEGMGDKHHHPLPPGQSTKVSFLLFPVSLPQTSNTLTCDREKIPHLIPFCKGFTCKKMWKKRKIYFLAGSSVWNMSQESCFWFMLNCTLNTEQCSCPLFILFQAAPTSHSHTQKIYAPTHLPHFQRIWTLLLVHTPEKHPHFE